MQKTMGWSLPSSKGIAIGNKIVDQVKLFFEKI